MVEQALPMGSVQTDEAVDITHVISPQHDPLQHAYALFENDIPDNATLSIEETDGKLIAKYIVRITYKSSKSNRAINVMAKGDRLPTEHDELYRYYIQQLILTPTEVAREFSRIYFLERRSRQEAFLFSKNNIRVSDTGLEDDKLTFKDYA